MNALVEFKPGRYVACIAFISGREPRDWLATLYRDAGANWIVGYRFRYYADGDPFSKKDRKSFYEGDTHDPNPLSEARHVSNLRLMAEMLVGKGYNDKLDWLSIRSDDPHKCLELLAAMPWAHMKAKQTS